jgi:hypothetical protein
MTSLKQEISQTHGTEQLNYLSHALQITGVDLNTILTYGPFPQCNKKEK